MLGITFVFSGRIWAWKEESQSKLNFGESGKGTKDNDIQRRLNVHRGYSHTQRSRRTWKIVESPWQQTLD